MAKEKMTKAEIQKRHHEIMVELDQIEERASKENRAFTAEENDKYDALVREDNRLHLDIQGMLDERELAKFNEQKSKSAQLREIFLQCRQERKSFTEVLQDREAANATTILLNPDTGNTHANIEASGAIPLTIHEIIDTKVPGLELPDDLRLLTGVVGDEVWPYSTDDVEFSIAGEVEKIGEQSLNFDKLKASPERVTAALAISNRAIDNTSFDLFGFCNYKLAKGWAIRKALLTYSHCVYSHSLKPIFSLVDVEEIVLDENIGKNLAKKCAQMWNKGFEGEPELVMDKETETDLLFTKRLPNSTGERTVIENGRCVGYRYKVSPYINYALDSNGVARADGNRYIGIGHWGYDAFQQHGEVRVTIDSTSAEVAKRNTTVIVMSTDLSISELSSKVNGNTSGKPQAFKLLKIVEAEPTTV